MTGIAELGGSVVERDLNHYWRLSRERANWEVVQPYHLQPEREEREREREREREKRGRGRLMR